MSYTITGSSMLFLPSVVYDMVSVSMTVQQVMYSRNVAGSMKNRSMIQATISVFLSLMQSTYSLHQIGSRIRFGIKSSQIALQMAMRRMIQLVHFHGIVQHRRRRIFSVEISKGSSTTSIISLNLVSLVFTSAPSSWRNRIINMTQSIT